MNNNVFTTDNAFNMDDAFEIIKTVIYWASQVSRGKQNGTANRGARSIGGSGLNASYVCVYHGLRS